VSRRVDLVTNGIKQLQASFKNGQTLSQGLKVCVLGAPNSGKSTLMNFLLQHDRAIVSSVRGTTRDYLEETCLINGKLVRVIDTAGIRATQDDIEQQGIKKSYQLAKQCDLGIVLLAADASKDDVLTTSELLFELKRDKRDFLLVKSKMDLVHATNSDLGVKALNNFPAFDHDISCQTAAGLEGLKEFIVSRVEKSLNDVGENGFVTTLRQNECLEKAQSYLKIFNELLKQKAGPELMAFELLEASRSMQEVVGLVSSEDVLDKVFRDFCIGK
jgi:tRNA modification GTPase